RVQILSGSDGKEITFFRGHRGLETRIFAAGRDDAGVRTLLGFGHLGRKRELRTHIFDGRKVGQLSLAVLETASLTVPGALRVVVGSGFNARHSVVEVYEAARRNRRLVRFHAFEGPNTGGVNVAAGQISPTGPEEIVAIEAYAKDHEVKAFVFSQLDSEGKEWAPTESFTVFRSNDTVAGVVPVNAGGGTVAAGDVIAGKPKREEIVAGTERGIPLVRVFDRNGKKLSEWLAYSGFSFQGVEVAVADLDEDGLSEVVTVPRHGPALVRVFDGKGNRITNKETGLPLEFFAFEQSFDRGVKVAAADVDFDGRQEILVVRNSGVDAKIKAFEIDGAVVEGWKDIMPFHRENVAIAATDRFVRR
ncbi:MAG: FG-GAP repeat domain-containing protein, partial [Candidatus Binatia bacterium]